MPSGSSLSLRTPRLELVAATSALYWAEDNNLRLFGKLLAAEVPQEWPPELVKDVGANFGQRLEADSAHYGWLSWYVILHGRGHALPTLVGAAGFIGKPDGDASVTLGYSFLPAFHNQGLATEAVAALVAWSFRQDRVETILADTFPQLKASIRVLEKNGFQQEGEGHEAGSLRFVKRRSETDGGQIAFAS